MLSVVAQVLIGLVTSSIGFMGRLLWERRIRYSMQNKSVREFWGFLESPTDVYLPFANEDRRGAAVGYGDLAALTEFMSLARDHFDGAKQVSVHTNQPRFQEGQNRQRNVLAIGGGKYNSIYRELITALDPPLHFFDTATESFQDIRNDSRSVQYSPRYSPDGTVVYDIGLIAWGPNPFDQSSRVVIVAGSHTYGSMAAMLFLSDPKRLKQLGRFRDERCVVVVGAPVQSHSISNDQVEQISSIVSW